MIQQRKELQTDFLGEHTCKNPQQNTAILNKSKGIGITMPDFKTYHRPITVKTLWCWHKPRAVEQQIKIETLEINLASTTN